MDHAGKVALERALVYAHVAFCETGYEYGEPFRVMDARAYVTELETTLAATTATAVEMTREAGRCAVGWAKTVGVRLALIEALQAMVDEQVDYMKINQLGDPEQQHNIKLARAALAKARGES